MLRDEEDAVTHEEEDKEEEVSRTVGKREASEEDGRGDG